MESLIYEDLRYFNFYKIYIVLIYLVLVIFTNIFVYNFKFNLTLKIIYFQ